MSRLKLNSDQSTPEYSVRISKRAKRLQMRVKPLGQIEVVLPKGMALRHVEPFVKQHQAWLEETLNAMPRSSSIAELLPQQIDFAATDECWPVEYINAAHARVSDKGGVLRVSGESEKQQLEALQRWYQLHAKRVLIPWLEVVSKELALPYSRVTVRGQKTRWGSCSSKKSISLNRALLFMSPEAVRYLMIHELCHTKYLNHSRLYWALVESFEPNYRRYDKQLHRAAKSLPAWAITSA